MQIYLIALLEFLYNNLVTVSIILTGALLLITSSRLIYLEYRFNHNLNLKKIFFGDRRPFRAQSFNIRRVFSFLFGFILIFLIIYQAYGEPISYQENTKSITSYEDALDIYENFNSKFYSDPFSNDLLEPKNPFSFQNNQADDFYGFDFVAESLENIFVLNQSGVQILSKNQSNVTYLRELPFPIPQCSLESFQPKGIALVNNLLFVVSTESLGQCRTNPDPYVLRDNRTHVVVYELNDFEKIDEYVISGHLNDIFIDNQQIIMVTSTWIPFADESLDFDTLIPFYIDEEATIRSSIEDIPYIENTDPNAFVTITKIDFLKDTVNQTSIITDYQNQIDIRNDLVLVALDVVNFNQASDLFELPNPIRSIDSAVVQFNIYNEDVYYFRTQKLEGTLSTNDAVHVYEEGLKVFTRLSSGSNYIYSLTHTLRYVSGKSLANQFEINSIILENDFFYLDYSKDFSRHYTYTITEDGLLLVSTRNETTFFDSYTELNESNYFSIQQFDNDILRLYLLSHIVGSSLYNIDLEVEFSVNNEGLIIESSDLENVFLLEDEDKLLIPMYLFTNDNQVISENEVAMYDFSSERVQSTVLGPLGQFKNPFVYRALVYGNILVHITPGGYRITDLNNIEEAFRTVYFANQ